MGLGIKTYTAPVDAGQIRIIHLEKWTIVERDSPDKSFFFLALSGSLPQTKIVHFNKGKFDEKS
jgi:hypothetical protein